MGKGLVDKLFIQHAREVNSIFYKNFNKAKFNKLDENKILELKAIAPNLLEEEAITDSKLVNYVKKMRRLNKKTENYNINNDAEKYILFMFSVDPNFEAIKIYGETNHITETKRKMCNFFGAYDSKLIKIEKEFIKLFLSEKEKQEINEEIEKRVFK